MKVSSILRNAYKTRVAGEKALLMARLQEDTEFIQKIEPELKSCDDFIETVCEMLSSIEFPCGEDDICAACEEREECLGTKRLSQ